MEKKIQWIVNCCLFYCLNFQQQQSSRRGEKPDIRLQYVDQLLAAFPQLELQTETPQLKVQNLVEPLSDRELEVLRLLAAGKSNQEIANELVLATGTVKKHLSNIFGKLGAQNRTQCVARARELELL